MGLYDGRLGARRLGVDRARGEAAGAPVVLVVDARGQSRSRGRAAARVPLVRPRRRRARWPASCSTGSAASGTRRCCGPRPPRSACPCSACCAARDALAVPSRHLGLVPAVEHGAAAVAAVDEMAGLVRAGTSISTPWSGSPRRCRGTGLGRGRRDSPFTPTRVPDDPDSRAVPPRLAVAGGAAFTFGYAEHAELLRPPGPRSSSSTRCGTRRCRRGRPGWCCAAGSRRSTPPRSRRTPRCAPPSPRSPPPAGPVHAECGGLLYLCRDLDGAPMCGVLPASRGDDRAAHPRLPGRRGAVGLGVVRHGAAGRRARVPPLRRDPPCGCRTGLGMARRRAGRVRRRRRARLVPAHPSGGQPGCRRAVRPGGVDVGAAGAQTASVSGGSVAFVGAGPGAADLITLRGARRIAAADVVIWAASLVTEELVTEHARPDAELVDSSLIAARGRPGRLPAGGRGGPAGRAGALRRPVAVGRGAGAVRRVRGAGARRRDRPRGLGVRRRGRRGGPRADHPRGRAVGGPHPAGGRQDPGAGAGEAARVRPARHDDGDLPLGGADRRSWSTSCARAATPTTPRSSSRTG